MSKTLVALTAIAVAVFLVAIFAGAQTVFDGNVESTGTLTGTTITASTGFTGDLTGAVTGNVTGDLTGAVAATTITASGATTLTGAVVCSSTVETQGTASFADSVYFGNDVVATTFTGALTGAVTGNVTGDVTGKVIGVVFQTAATQGALPAAASSTGQCFMNTTGDSGWVADNDSWVKLWP